MYSMPHESAVTPCSSLQYFQLFYPICIYRSPLIYYKFTRSWLRYWYIKTKTPGTSVSLRLWKSMKVNAALWTIPAVTITETNQLMYTTATLTPAFRMGAGVPILPVAYLHVLRQYFLIYDSAYLIYESGMNKNSHASSHVDLIRSVSDVGSQG